MGGGGGDGPMNESRWEKMAAGDVVLIYNSGRIRFAGEIAAKVRNKDLARYFWKENEAGSTGELMYFIVYEGKTDVPTCPHPLSPSRNFVLDSCSSLLHESHLL